jgi:pimeloyl-ACP methyl ester carboxylesterase
VGFVGIIPDFLGFGASKQMLHPYYIEEATASAVLDNIRAGRELALVNGLALNNKLFLAGYSEGGYATLATHKAIEEKGYNELNLVASFPASGGYDVKGMQEYFFGLETYHEPFYLAYVAQAYKNFYDWPENAGLLFNEPYASRIPSLFDGSKGGGEINAQLSDDVSLLLNPSILTGIDTDNQFIFLRNAFVENSLTDWSPSVPVYMYHGTDDITVPYENSVRTYDRLIANGTSTANLSLTPLHFSNHNTGITPYIIEVTNKLLAFK